MFDPTRDEEDLTCGIRVKYMIIGYMSDLEWLLDHALDFLSHAYFDGCHNGIQWLMSV